MKFDERVFEEACNMYFDWYNGNGVSQSDCFCFCWENDLDEEAIADFVWEHQDEYSSFHKKWTEMLK